MTLQNTLARLRSREGFTLIELLIVMVVLGILFVIGLFLFNDVRESAENTSARAEVRAAYTQAKAFYVDNGTFTGADAADGDVALNAQLMTQPAGTADLISLVGICPAEDGPDTTPSTADDLVGVLAADLVQTEGQVDVCGADDTVFVGKRDANGNARYLIDNGNAVDDTNL